jgi:dTDP-4-dehydrorhamnose reductase
LKTNVAIIGAKGFVGKALVRAFEEQNISVTPVLRGDSISDKVLNCDLVIHTACTGRRFWANNHPEEDFCGTVELTEKILKECTNKKIVFISSISARTQSETPYGKHRKQCEDLILNSHENLVIRMGPMLDVTKLNGPIVDLFQSKKLYMSEDSKMAVVPLAYNAKKVVDLMGERGLLELGAKDFVSLKELKIRFSSTSEFEGIEDSQVPIGPPGDAPSVEVALAILENQV